MFDVRVAGGVAALLVLVLGSPAGADAQNESGLKLVVHREPGSEDCPDGDELRSRVIALLEMDPFVSNGAATLECVVRRSDDKYVARLVLTEANGEQVGERELSTSAANCDSLADLVELALATAASGYVSTVGGRSNPPSASARRPVAAFLAGPLTAPDDAPSVSSVHTSLTVGSRGRLGFDTNGETVASGALAVGYRYRQITLQLELQLDESREVRRSTGTSVQVGSGSFNAVACGHRWAAVACLVTSAGWVRGSSSNLVFSREPVTPRIQVGARLGWEVSLGRSFYAQASIDLMRAATNTRFTIGVDVVWETPPYTGGLGISLARRFQ